MASTESTRSAHPYFMHDHIQSQPNAFRHVAERNRDLLTGLAQKIAERRRLFLVGIGTSYHAALLGGHLLRCFAHSVACEVWHSFEFALYGPPLSADDVVLAVSHRGAKRFTLQALARASDAGCATAMISGINAPPPPMSLGAMYETVDQERSSAHTASLVGAVGLLSELARQLSSDSSMSVELLDRVVPDALSLTLATEQQMAGWAAEYHGRRRIWLVGCGPTAVTAHEIALKIKETSYLQAEGFAVETLLHGPFQCCEPDDLFVLIAPHGPGRLRIMELPPMIAAVGAKCVLITDRAGTGDAATDEPPAPEDRHVADTCVVPALPEPFEAIVTLTPLQLLTYHLALQRKTNPDSFRLDDSRFAMAMGKVKL